MGLPLELVYLWSLSGIKMLNAGIKMLNADTISLEDVKQLEILSFRCAKKMA